MNKPYYQDDFVTLCHGNSREITEWLDADVLVTDRLFYAYSYTVGVLALVVVGPFLFANGQLQDRPLARIAETAREHANGAYPDVLPIGGQP